MKDPRLQFDGTVENVYNLTNDCIINRSLFQIDIPEKFPV